MEEAAETAGVTAVAFTCVSFSGYPTLLLVLRKIFLHNIRSL
jgi:hypothetical protein